ncbi:hypothetical protein ACMFMG_007237 [Clarireedia jacksonii]
MGIEKILAAGKKLSSSKSSSSSPIPLETIFRFPGVLTEVSGIAKNLSEGWTAYQNGVAIRNQIEAVLPEVQTFATGVNRYLKNKNWLDAFQTFLVGANVVACFMDVLQGSSGLEEIGLKIHSELEAQTGLAAPDKFAKHVDKYIRKEAASVYAGGAEHLYFLYHPDTDWHGEFHDIVQNKPVPSNFLGMSENLHALCTWMLFMRKRLTKSGINARFHLLIPAYRPMVIRQSFVFPEELYPLTVHGHIHNSKEYVWLNLPTMQELSPDVFELSNIGNIASIPKPPKLWEHALTWVGSILMPRKEPPPIVLGRGATNNNAGEVAEESDEKLRPPEDITVQPETRQIYNGEKKRRHKHRSSPRVKS